MVRPITKDWPAIRRDYEQGEALKTISQRHDVTRRAINNKVKLQGWERPKPRFIDVETIREDYLIAKLTRGAIARKHGVTPRTIKSLVAKYKWYRNPTQADPFDLDEEADATGPRDPLGDKLAALGFVRQVAPPSDGRVSGPAWVR